jgi:uncharacterized protein with PIN domain
MGERPRFLADEMLGTLVKWLRIMGYDTSYAKDMKDEEIAALALREGRSLLTRDKALAKIVGCSGLYVISDVIEEQVAQVARAYGLNFDASNTRCALCNGALMPIPPDEARNEVPVRSFGMTDRFFRCQGCSKLYWEGTHWNKIKERMRDFGL